MKLKIEYIDPRSLIAYENNSRVHSADQIDRIKRSIEEFGFINPVIIDESNTIVAGHARVESAVDLGLSEVPTISVEHLTEEQIKAYVIADNRLAELSSWNDDILTEELKWLDEQDFDITITGFDDISFDIDDVLNEEDDFEVVEPEEPVSKLGDIWLLGEHRVMCGDSTSFDDVDKLMQGSKADMCFTDPPYGVSYKSGMSDRFDVIENDDIFLDIKPVVCNFVKNNSAVFVWTSHHVYTKWRDIMGDLYNQTIVWCKGGGGMGDIEGSYILDYELCLFCKIGSPKLKSKRRGAVWEVGKDTASKYVHPTQKPIELSMMACVDFTAKGDIVLDLFGGSGSTLIGCDKVQRKARLMELDPKYVDVIIDRWQKHTGKEAILESTGETYNELKGDQDD